MFVTGSREAVESRPGKQRRRPQGRPARPSRTRPSVNRDCAAGWASRRRSTAGHRSILGPGPGSASTSTGGKACSKQMLDAVLIVCTHGLIPCLSRSFLSNRRARKTRSFTAATEIPSASATSLCGCSSTTDEHGRDPQLGGRRAKACAVFERISAVTPGSADDP